MIVYFFCLGHPDILLFFVQCAAGSHGPVSEHSRTLWMEPIGINGRFGC